MIPHTQELQALLKGLCADANGDPRDVACCRNYLFEERVSRQRQESYEGIWQDQARNPAPDFAAWDHWHRDRYLPQAILYREVPETFTTHNAAVAHSGDLQGNQRLVRVENLRHALRETGLTIDELQEILMVATGAGSANKYRTADAQAALEDLYASLNRNPHSFRPRFAGFLHDLEDTIKAPDWANRARDRFGLAHLDPEPGETLSVALMSYPVREVLRAARAKAETVHPICVPAVLDHEFTACFLPAPRQLPYGRTLQLMGDPKCEKMIAEVLHLRFPYKPEHIHKVGAVTEPVTGLTDPGLDSLRTDHLFCLQYESERDDFGCLPTGWNHPLSMPLRTSHTPAWLQHFRAEPETALDDMLRGLARVPPYERAAPPDILDRLFGNLPVDDPDRRLLDVLAPGGLTQRVPVDDPDRRLLDETLCDWLAARRAEMDPERHTEYGLPRFVTEVMDALSTVWLLELPRSGTWIQDNFLELTHRAAPLRLSPVWDLPRALAQAAALTQTDQRLRLYWLRLCKDAARSSLRDMIDPALSGLSNLPDAKGQGAGPALIAGLARFGAGLSATPRDQRDFLRRWRALKARFPRTGKTWRGLWQAPLTNRQYRERPFIDWLKETEPALNRHWTGGGSGLGPAEYSGNHKGSPPACAAAGGAATRPGQGREAAHHTGALCRGHRRRLFPGPFCLQPRQ